MEGTFSNDSLWRLPSASLRKGQLYFKAPASFVQRLTLDMRKVLLDNPGLTRAPAFEELQKFLHEQMIETRLAGQSSVVIATDLATTEKDLETLTSVPVLPGHLEIYVSTLRRGLANDPEVDWIRRVGGPGDKIRVEGSSGSRKPAPRLELVEITDEEIQSLFE